MRLSAVTEGVVLISEVKGFFCGKTSCLYDGLRVALLVQKMDKGRGTY